MCIQASTLSNLLSSPGPETGSLVSVGEGGRPRVHRRAHLAAPRDAVRVAAPHVDRRRTPRRRDVPERHPDVGAQRREARSREGTEEVDAGAARRQDPRPPCQGSLF